MRVPRVVLCAMLLALCLLTTGRGLCDRVLLVTTESPSPPNHFGAPYTAEYAATDLVAAGIPFDLATYGRFVAMPLDDYDVIILSGTTTPTSVAAVAAKCESAISEGRKVFINGHWPHQRLNPDNTLAEEIRYTLTLFGVNDGGLKLVSGSASIPSGLEKDPWISAFSHTNMLVRTFTFSNPPDVVISYAGKAVGFLYPNGGAIDSTADWLLYLLDYGKLVSYLRYGDPAIIGFANDRIEGQPIASFEVHCDISSYLPAIEAINSLSADLEIPLINLLVYDRLTPETIARWNSLTNPLMTIGSHSRTHPWQWPPVPNVMYETRDVLNLQREIIPATRNFFNFSGKINPTKDQIDQIYGAGVVFGAGGVDQRRCKLPTGEYVWVQYMPLRTGWVHALAQSTSTPFCPSQTVMDDISCFGGGINYADEVKRNFAANIKYGMYNYGFIHDNCFTPYSYYNFRGTPMPQIIRSAYEYLKSQGCKFIATDELILRLWDYVAGNIAYVSNPDGSATLTVTRPGALINEIKVGCRGDYVPSASGPSVISQRLGRGHLYVALQPEVTSTVELQWVVSPPPPPSVAPKSGYVSTASEVHWVEGDPTGAPTEFEFAVGTSPGGTDAKDWTFVGTATSASLASASLQHLRAYHVSVRTRRPGGSWTEPGVSSPLIADLTPPLRSPVVVDDGAVQFSKSRLHAVWTANDEESGIRDYWYAIGTAPGSGDVVDWTLTTANEIEITDLHLTSGVTYYVSVRARNGADLWSSIGSSDGITVISESCGIGEARNYPDGAPVYLKGKVVTAVFPGEFYIESKDRCAGIKVLSNIPVQEGDEVDVAGVMGRSSGERFVAEAVVSVTGRADLRPLKMACKAMGGGNNGQTTGPSGGFGLNNVGLLITISGRVTGTDSDSVFVDDGSGLDGPNGQVGVRVVVGEGHGLQVGQWVVATGISTLETDGTTYWRRLLTRRPSDVTAYSL